MFVNKIKQTSEAVCFADHPSVKLVHSTALIWPTTPVVENVRRAERVKALCLLEQTLRPHAGDRARPRRFVLRKFSLCCKNHQQQEPLTDRMTQLLLVRC